MFKANRPNCIRMCTVHAFESHFPFIYYYLIIIIIVFGHWPATPYFTIRCPFQYFSLCRCTCLRTIIKKPHSVRSIWNWHSLLISAENQWILELWHILCLLAFNVYALCTIHELSKNEFRVGVIPRNKEENYLHSVLHRNSCLNIPTE